MRGGRSGRRRSPGPILDKPCEWGAANDPAAKVPPGMFKITALEPGKSFTWASGIPGIVYVHARHSIEPAPLGAKVTLAIRFDGLLGGLMGKRMAELNHQYLAMEAAGLKRFSEEGARDPGTSLEAWSAEAVRRLNEQRSRA